MRRAALLCALGALLGLSLSSSGCSSGGVDRDATRGSAANNQGGASSGIAGASASGGAGNSAGAVSGAPSGPAPLGPAPSGPFPKDLLPFCGGNENPGTACTAGSDCYRICGPERLGSRAITCGPSGVYEEGACAFPPSGDYSCYKLRSPLPACPTGIRLGLACIKADCTTCGDPVGAVYADTAGNPQPGFCMCTTGSWDCKSINDYPCHSPAGYELPASCW